MRRFTGEGRADATLAAHAYLCTTRVGAQIELARRQWRQQQQQA
jgi:hypothetical protein